MTGSEGEDGAGDNRPVSVEENDSKSDEIVVDDKGSGDNNGEEATQIDEEALLKELIAEAAQKFQQKVKLR